jgi:hypothetical protein
MKNIMVEFGRAAEDAGANAYTMFEDIRQGAMNAGVNMKQFNPLLDQI